MFIKIRPVLLINLFLIFLFSSCWLSNPKDNPYQDDEATESDYNIVQNDTDILQVIYGDSDSSASVTQNIILPTTGSSGVTSISWSSSDREVIADTGIVE